MSVGVIKKRGSKRALEVTRLKPVILIGVDIAAAFLAAAASFELTNMARDFLGLPPIELSSQSARLHLSIVLALTAALILWFRSKGHYRRRQALSDQLASILSGTALALMCAASMQFATVEVGSRMITFLHWVLFAIALVTARTGARTLLQATQIWSRSAILFAASDRDDAIVRFLKRRGEVGAHVIGRHAIDQLEEQAILDAIKNAYDEDHLVIFAPAQGDVRQAQIVEQLVMEGIPFLLSPDIGPVPDHAEMLEFPPEDIAFMEISDPLARPLALLTKRAFDVVAAVIGLIVLSPVFIGVAIAIRADGGPAIFRQARIGREGETFQCLKFRSMVINAEKALEDMIAADPEAAAEWKAYQKLKKDPRITLIGRFIRKTNIDELPQLINVIRGDMSLVGPRPMTLPQIAEYGSKMRAYVRMRPGITGLWQTNGRNETTFEERARLDAWYVRNWSIWRDFIILVRTIREVVFARGN